MPAETKLNVCTNQDATIILIMTTDIPWMNDNDHDHRLHWLYHRLAHEGLFMHKAILCLACKATHHQGRSERCGCKRRPAPLWAPCDAATGPSVWTPGSSAIHLDYSHNSPQEPHNGLGHIPSWSRLRLPPLEPASVALHYLAQIHSSHPAAQSYRPYFLGDILRDGASARGPFNPTWSCQALLHPSLYFDALWWRGLEIILKMSMLSGGRIPRLTCNSKEFRFS